MGTPNCAGTGSCALSVSFSPRSPGTRQDAVVVKDSSGSVLALTYLQGIGIAPQSAVLPGTISTQAGNGIYGYSGDGGAANSGELRLPQAVAVDEAGNVYIADTGNNVIRRVAAATGIITTVAGNGLWGYSGDGRLATTASLADPTGVALDAAGNLYIADFSNNVIRKVNAITGVISTVVGGGSNPGDDGLGDNGPATDATLYRPAGLAFDVAGNLYIADSYNSLIRKVSLMTGIISVVAGGGSNPGTDALGDGGPATEAQLGNPMGVALDTSGNLYIADTGNNLVREVNSGTITAIAGNGNPGYQGDNGPALNAKLNAPSSVGLDTAGNLYIADTNNNMIRRVDGTTGIISRMAGNRTAGYAGDAGVPTTARLNYPSSIALDAGANLYIADNANNVIRKIAMVATPLSFPQTTVGQVSGAQSIIIVNIGNAPLNFSGLAVSANFQQQTSGGRDCLSSTILTAAGSCTMAVAFAPISAGHLTGSIQLVTDSLNASGSSPNIILSGTGVGPAVALNPSSLTFGNQNLSTTSADQTVILSNPGSAAVTLTGITVTGTNASEFSQTNTCAATLGAGASCTISVTFIPSLVGARSASITVTDSAAGSPHTAALSGTGVGVAQISLNPSSLTFGNQNLASVSAAQTITVSNSGSAALSITSVAIAGTNAADFIQTNTCGASVAAGASCTISVTFTPALAGARSASVAIADNATGSPHMLNLTGTGVARLEATNEEPGDVRIQGDFDLDGKLDVGFWRPSSGTWYVNLSNLGARAQHQWGLPGDIPVPADYTGRGGTDYAVWRPSNGTWYIMPSNGAASYAIQWGLPGDMPVTGDFDGDGKSDLAVWRPSNATWYIIPSGTGMPYSKQWGLPGDLAEAADYDGDGKIDVAVWRPSDGAWYVAGSTGVVYRRKWGTSGDVPAPADYDGDGRADFAVWRPSNGLWYIMPTSNSASAYTAQWGLPTNILIAKFTLGSLGKGVYIRVAGDFDGDGQLDFAVWQPVTGKGFIIPTSHPGTPISQQCGQQGDVPASGDFDGDGRTDFAVWRPSNGTWYITPSNGTPPYAQQWGQQDDFPTTGDYDGDGKADIAVWRPSTGTWYIMPSNGGARYSQQWGLPDDIPTTGDYDGDGKADIAVWRPSTGTWYIMPSNGGARYSQQWGTLGDVPVVGDLGGHGKAKYVIWRPSTQSWFVFWAFRHERRSAALGHYALISHTADRRQLPALPQRRCRPFSLPRSHAGPQCLA
ncbi:MAG: choice-of-anchor D domain-containing protein [Bryobacteraceae bacterium]